MPEIRMPVGGTTPPTPSVNEVSLYVKGDKRFYMQDDTGAEVKLLTDEATLASLTTQLPLTDTGGANPTLAINNVTSGASNATTIAAGVINDANISATAAIAITKLAVDPRDRSTHTGLQLASTISDFGSGVDAHLTGTAPIVDAMIDASAGIALSKLAVDPLDRANHTGTQTAGTISDFTAQVDLDIAAYLVANPLTNTEIDAAAAIDLSKLATDPLDRANHTGTQLAATISDFSTEVPLALTPGNGIDITTGIVSVDGTAARIDVSGGTVDIDAAYVGQASITTLGAVTTGTWNASTIGVGVGGTGGTSAGTAANSLVALRIVTSSDTLDDEDTYVIADATASVVTIALPSASNLYRYVIKKIDAANNVVINADVGDLIDGLGSTTLTTQYDYIEIVSDGFTSWHIISG